MSSPTTRRISATSATVAPPGPKPVDVFTKSAPAAFASVHAVTFSSSVRYAASMMTLLDDAAVAARAGHRLDVALDRRAGRRDLSAPMLITMSTSRAPSKITRRVSKFLTSGVVAPSGKPTTAQTPTGVSRSRRAQSATHVGIDADGREAKLRGLAAQLFDVLPASRRA